MKKQTALRSLRVRINDTLLDASFVFPFFDSTFWVRFFLVVADSGHFLVYERPHWERRMFVAYGKRPLPLANTQPDRFLRLFHFDPWWTMRGATSISRTIRQEIIATNLAARRQGHLVIRDVVFSDDLEQVEGVLVGDGVFRAVSYNQARPMPQDMQEVFFGRSANG